MKSLVKNLVAVAAVSTMVACTGGGGNGNGSSGGGGGVGSTPALTHNQLAEKFVQQLNLDSEFEVELVKKSTLEENFVVIYDPYTDSYDALNIDSYNPNFNNASDYYYANSARGFFDLDIIHGHYEADFDYTIIGYDDFGDAVWGYEEYDVWVPTRYEDYATGMIFEKVAGSSKDLAKVVALKEIAQISKSAQFLSSEFGLSLERSVEVAGLQAHWKKASIKAMTSSEVDAFSTELLGFSLTSGIAAHQANSEGNSNSLDSLIEQSASANGITPEHATKLMTKVFGL
jgi:hypothetical protein